MRGIHIFLALFLLQTLLISARVINSRPEDDDEDGGEGPAEDGPDDLDPEQDPEQGGEEREEAPIPKACWISSYGRGVGTIPSCEKDFEKDAGLCYPKCPDNFKSVGPVCWANEISYGRGVGSPANQCGPNQEKDAGLCYNKCNSGYHPVGPVCWKGIQSHGRGAGSVPSDCGEGRERDAGLCYPRCKPGFHGIGPVCWNDNKSIARGVGKIPTACPNGDNDAGLCYTKCNPGFKGIGPVCWQNSCPPDFPTNCGAICVATAETCGETMSSIAHHGINLAIDPATGVSGSMETVKEIFKWAKCQFSATGKYN